jgi:hypothetical protein
MSEEIPSPARRAVNDSKNLRMHLKHLLRFHLEA